jgi:hypothetical protein
MTWSRVPAIGLFIAAFVQLGLFVLFVGLTVTGVAGPAGTPLLITGAILGVIGLILLYAGRRMLHRYKEAQRLRAEGVDGQAQIMEMSQTGVTMNDQPQIQLRLMVTTPVHGSYEKIVREYVPLMQLGRLSNGLPLPVKVDRNNRENLIIDWSNGGMPGMVGVPGMAGMPGMGAMPGMAGKAGMPLPPLPDPAQADAVKQRLLATGMPGVARVLSVNYTGQLDGQGRPVYEVHLHIEVDGKPPMTGPARFGVPPERVSVMQVGGMIPLRVDPANPAMMAADWDRVPS